MAEAFKNCQKKHIEKNQKTMQIMAIVLGVEFVLACIVWYAHGSLTSGKVPSDTIVPKSWLARSTPLIGLAIAATVIACCAYLIDRKNLWKDMEDHRAECGSAEWDSQKTGMAADLRLFCGIGLFLSGFFALVFAVQALPERGGIQPVRVDDFDNITGMNEILSSSMAIIALGLLAFLSKRHDDYWVKK